MIRTFVLAVGLASTLHAWSEDPLVQRMASHRQSWGVLGRGVAAHAPDIEPMPMRIGTRTFSSGLGTHAPSETVYVLDGQFLSFSCDVGVQWIDEHPPSGTVIFRILVDGREAFNSGVMDESAPAKHVEVDLKGASELQLLTEDSGDGIFNDLCNWADAKLVQDPGVPDAKQEPPVDIAPFAHVMTWDPARMEGTKATRLETMPAEDLFPRREVLSKNGGYEAPVYGDGRACLGLEWLERRRIVRIETEFADASPAIEGATLQFWRMTQKGGSPGGSRWQGAWVPVKGAETREDKVWTTVPQWEDQHDLMTGTLALRWVFPSQAKPVVVRAMRVFTATRWKTVDLLIQTAPNGGSSQANVKLYNGALVDGGMERTWNPAQPLRVSVRYCPARSWEIADRTVLRFTVGEQAFGVAVDDVMRDGNVYVANAGLLVSRADGAPTIDAYRASIADKKTILEQVRSMPDQTSTQAADHVHRLDADTGPTMLSLACDNRKFIVEREGGVAWEDSPEGYNKFDAQYLKPYACRMAASFGDGKPAYVGRSFQREWLPVQVLTVANRGLTYRQRTFVAPFGKTTEGTLPWVQHQALGVAEYTITNPTADPAPAELAIRFVVDVTTDRIASVEGHDDTFVVRKDGALLAVVRAIDLQGLKATTEPGVVRFSGTLPRKATASAVVFLPRWEGAAPEELAAAPTVDTLVADTEAYWMRAMGPAMHVEVPDDLFNRLIPASQIHCLLAARNERGEGVAPWIASLYYGPLESEANSVLRGMLYNGQTDFVRRSLDYYIARYNEQGFLTTGYTVMGTGWHLWTLGEYYKLTHDGEWLRGHAPEVARVCRWIMNERRKTMTTDVRGERVPEFGLMPPGVGADWDAFAYYFYLSGYYCTGLGAAAEALADIGWEGAPEMVADAAAFRQDILRAFEYVQKQAPVNSLRDGMWVPSYPTHVYSPAPIENLYKGEDGGRSWAYDVELGAHHLIPMGIIAPNSPIADWTISHMEDVQFLRPGWFYYEDAKANQADWFNLGGFAKVQPYYARTGEVHAMRDDVKPFIRAYFNSVFSLLNREDLSLWEHFMNGAFNKTHETGYFLHQTRLMFVQERGDELWLAPFVTDQWLRDGIARRGRPRADLLRFRGLHHYVPCRRRLHRRQDRASQAADT